MIGIKNLVRFGTLPSSDCAFCGKYKIVSEIKIQPGATSLILADHRFFKESRVRIFNTHPILALYQQLPISVFDDALPTMSEAVQDEAHAGEKRPNALELGPRKKAYVDKIFISLTTTLMFTFIRCLTDPLVHHGRHFGRTVHAMCNFPTLLNNGIMRIVDQLTPSDASLTPE